MYSLFVNYSWRRPSWSQQRKSLTVSELHYHNSKSSSCNGIMVVPKGHTRNNRLHSHSRCSTNENMYTKISILSRMWISSRYASLEAGGQYALKNLFIYQYIHPYDDFSARAYCSYITTTLVYVCTFWVDSSHAVHFTISTLMRSCVLVFQCLITMMRKTTLHLLIVIVSLSTPIGTIYKNISSIKLCLCPVISHQIFFRCPGPCGLVNMWEGDSM